MSVHYIKKYIKIISGTGIFIQGKNLKWALDLLYIQVWQQVGLYPHLQISTVLCTTILKKNQIKVVQIFFPQKRNSKIILIILIKLLDIQIIRLINLKNQLRN